MEGGGRRLHSFRSYVRLTRQTLAGVPHCCVMSQAGRLEAIQTDSSLLDWSRSSLRALLCRGSPETVSPHIALGAVQASLVTLPHLICKRIRAAL